MRNMNIKLISVFVLAFFIAGCAIVDVTKTSKGFNEPTDPNEIEILKTIPSRPFEELGTVTAARFAADESAKMHNAIRAKAAPLGANAVVLQQAGFDAEARQWATGVAIRYTKK